MLSIKKLHMSKQGVRFPALGSYALHLSPVALSQHQSSFADLGLSYLFCMNKLYLSRVLSLISAPARPVLQTQLSDLTRLTLEARDNVKFLLTLERHFKNVTAGSLQSVADTLHPMLNALRMVRQKRLCIE